MNAKKKNIDSAGNAIPNESQEPRQEPRIPKPREFEARPCVQCVALRPFNTNYSRVYKTLGRIRYCKCHFCGNTWAQEG